MKILVIDDEAATLASITRLIERMGHSTVTASSGAEGLDCVRDDNIDCAIVDCWMPVETGFDVLHELAVTRPGMPVILTSAMATRGTERAAMEQGATAFLDKSDMTERLRPLLESLPQSSATPPAIEPVSTAPPASGMRGVLLLADDHEAYRHAAKRVLTREGYAVIEAANGADAVAFWKRGGIDAAIIDIHMPDMSGITAARLIREEDPFAMIALISGEAAHDERQAGTEFARMGCIDKMLGTDRLGRIAHFLVHEARRIRDRVASQGVRKNPMATWLRRLNKQISNQRYYWRNSGERRMARLIVTGLAVTAILAVFFLNIVHWYETRIFDLERREDPSALHAPQLSRDGAVTADRTGR